MKGIVGGLQPAAGGADGVEVAARMGRMSELLTAEFKGKYAEQCSRGNVFTANVSGVTVPVVANNLVSVFTLYNPPGSGINMELIDFVAPVVLATTVVDGIGLYYSSAALTAAGTFTTRGVEQCGLLGQVGSARGRFYSAFTHSGTPVLAKLLGGWAAVTDAGANGVEHSLDGAIIIPPGIACSVAMTTAASTASGVALSLSWAELPV
jgi:hypothetical protein